MRFLSALGALDGESIRHFQKPFRALTEAQQVEVLQAASAGKPGQEEWVWTPGTPVEKPDRAGALWLMGLDQAQVRDEVLTLRDHFDHVKAWITERLLLVGGRSSRSWATPARCSSMAFPDCTHTEHS